MAKFKALLIGVNRYTNKRQFKNEKTGALEWRDASLKSAKLDAVAVADLLAANVDKLGFTEASGIVLTGDKNTTRSKILDALHALGAGAGPGDQLLLYFSGHSTWTLCSDSEGKKKWYQMALCPSDTKWDEIVITAGDVTAMTSQALAKQACLEVILETCSAQGLAPGELHLYGFGDTSNKLPPFARWDAAAPLESSHSGPVPPCIEAPHRGLFTHFFCKRFIDQGQPRPRDTLLQAITKDLAQYQSQFNRCCDGKWPKDDAQTPALTCAKPMEALATLRSNCHGEEPKADAEPAADLAWISPERIPPRPVHGLPRPHRPPRRSP
jgi:hypothetical protein